MKSFRLLLLALLSALAVSAAARDIPPVLAVPPDQAARTDLATLVLPITMDISAVDGISYRGFNAFGRKGDLVVRVLPGAREVTVRYNMLFQLNADQHEIVKSKQMVLTFLAEAGKTYRVEHAKFRDVDAAHAGVENFVVQIEDADGNNRVIRASQSSSDWKGETTANQRPDLVNAELAASVAAAPVAAVAPAAQVAVAASAAPAAAAAPSGGTLNAVELMKFTWRNASAADRAAFLEWVKTNP